MSEAYPRVIETVRKVVASGLIYLPSSAKDFDNPEINRYLGQYVRGSNDMGHIERIKIMKLLWDATGTEFGGRHALYELNYAGAPEEVRLQVLKGAERGGRLREMEALVDTCMSDYDENGCTGDTWLPPIGTPAPLKSAAE
jgi:4-hydroxyphenylacetate 3-monooxygenase